MSRSILDKLFFLDKIDANHVLDYGCADGTLIEHMIPWLPETSFIGYDIDANMLELARKKVPNARFFSRWSSIASIFATEQKSAVVLSSVIHEIYHYQEPHEIDQFWRNLFNIGFKYIVIRDMIPNKTIDRPSDMNDVTRVYNTFADNNTPLQDFQNIWGSIENNRSLVHFLLKYKYVEPNWNREVRENYFPIYRDDLLAKIPSNYRVTYHEHYCLPYLVKSIRNDLGIDLKDSTHLKLILEAV